MRLFVMPRKQLARDDIADLEARAAGDLPRLGGDWCHHLLLDGDKVLC